MPAFEDTIKAAEAILYGPGIGPTAEPEVLRQLLSADKPFVLDADGLRCLAGNPRFLKGAPSPQKIILTPHPGEMRALLEAFAPEAVKMERREQALALCRATGCVVVLKGARTVVAEPGSEAVSYNLSGNPALATAGSGDVLAGVITTFATQMSPAAAARLGVFLHGLAADIYVQTASARGLVADDIPALIPLAIRACAFG